MRARGGKPKQAHRRWTSEEEDTIRRLYPTSMAGVIEALPHRTPHAIKLRAQTLRVANYEHRRTPWSTAENMRLRALWERGLSIEVIARRMERTRQGVFKHARLLRLQFGVPQGFEYLTDAANRAGVAVSTLWMILKWADVATTAVRTRRSHRIRRRYYVDPFDVDEAVKKWLSTETISASARARDVARTVLRKWLLQAGTFTPKATGDSSPHRIPTEVIDRVVAERRGGDRKAT